MVLVGRFTSVPTTLSCRVVVGLEKGLDKKLGWKLTSIKAIIGYKKMQIKIRHRH